MPVKLPILTVSELNKNAQAAIEQQLGRVAVTGEISNWVRASSGHCYFSLKDENAQVRCACFRSSANTIRFAPANGLAVVAHAKASLYPARGDYQLIVDSMEKAGEGQLAALFNRLKKKLKAQGLFDREKQPLPLMPSAIGIITSPTGAAIEDIKKVLGRRFPLTPLTIFPSMVQGEHAAKTLISAIKLANQHNQCDVLILARGGGSMEDLWAFNDEQLAHTIAQSAIPIITGIGHESDFTIADYVADVRAATPSAAAEQTVPDQKQLLMALSESKSLLLKNIQSILETKKAQLQHLKARLKHPSQLLLMQAQTLDHLQQRLIQAIENRLNTSTQQLTHLQRRLQSIPMAAHTTHIQENLANLKNRLIKGWESMQIHKKQQLETLAIQLNLHNPLNILTKGYAILSTQSNTKVTSITETKGGETLYATLKDGQLTLKVISQTPTKQ